MAHWKEAAVTNEGVEMLNEWMAGRKITMWLHSAARGR